jgi:hypothetical protein
MLAGGTRSAAIKNPNPIGLGLIFAAAGLFAREQLLQQPQGKHNCCDEGANCGNGCDECHFLLPVNDHQVKLRAHPNIIFLWRNGFSGKFATRLTAVNPPRATWLASPKIPDPRLWQAANYGRINFLREPDETPG